jgi:hypothetical protein
MVEFSWRIERIFYVFRRKTRKSPGRVVADSPYPHQAIFSSLVVHKGRKSRVFPKYVDKTGDTVHKRLSFLTHKTGFYSKNPYL